MQGFQFLPPDAAEGASRVDAIYFGLLALGGFIILLVAGLVIVFSARYRRGSRAKRKPPPKWLSREIEIGWTAVTLFVFLFIFWWAASQNLTALDPPANPLHIHVVAKQWMWKAEHANGIREIDEIHLPAGRDVLLSLNSQDVIHSFYVPAFRIKRDVVPGTTQQVWFRPTVPGRYHLLCAEFCGTSHSRMRGSIVVMEPQQFARWAASSPNTDNLAAEGAALFRSFGCSGCHEDAGTVRAPDLKGLFGAPVPLSDGRVVTADERYIRDSILFPTQDVVASYPAIMPSFEGRISDGELLRIVAYIKSLGKEARP